MAKILWSFVRGEPVLKKKEESIPIKIIGNFWKSQEILGSRLMIGGNRGISEDVDNGYDEEIVAEMYHADIA